jgi:two-component system chemotaxis sensor kinase CheA
MELNEEEIHSSEITSELHDLFNEVAKDKQLSFTINDHFDNLFTVDKTKLLQILKNLLSNAFKFTKEGGVSLTLDQQDDHVLRVSVKDSGIGIAPDKLSLIFEAFKQVDGSISREYGGTGLGLSISRTFITLMRGSIDVQSQEGEGSTFTVFLPLHEMAKLPQQEVNIEQSIVTPTPQRDTLLSIEDSDETFDSDLLTGKNILIVDDDSRNIFTLSSTLQELGAETFSALNGEEAIALLNEEETPMDIILMDVMMPIMDGLEAIRNIKQNDLFGHIPIIAITAKTMKEDKQACFEAGANDYLPKPINHNALIAMIQAWS